MSLSNPNDSLLTSDNALAVAELRGSILESFYNKSLTRPYFDITSLDGTSKLSGEKVGGADVMTFGPGDAAAPAGSKYQFEEVSIEADTEVITRYTTRQLDKMLSNPSALNRVARRQGTALAIAFDEMVINMAIKAALTAANGVDLGGSSSDIAAADLTNGAALESAIRDMRVLMETTKDIDPSDLTVFVTADIESALLTSGMITSQLTSEGNANVAAHEIYRVGGMPIQVVSPKAFGAETVAGHHKLSNSTNGNRYDIDGTQAKAKIVVASADSLLVGEGMSLRSSLHEDPVSRLAYLDSYFAAAAGVFNASASGVIKLA